MAFDLGLAIGVTLMAIGLIIALFGCIKFLDESGYVYNEEDVDAMVAATVKEKQNEEVDFFKDFKPGEKSKKTKVLMA